jgi:hypothetical protein
MTVPTDAAGVGCSSESTRSAGHRTAPQSAQFQLRLRVTSGIAPACRVAALLGYSLADVIRITEREGFSDAPSGAAISGGSNTPPRRGRRDQVNDAGCGKYVGSDVHHNAPLFQQILGNILAVFMLLRPFLQRNRTPVILF